MQRLEVSCAVRRIYRSLGAKGLIKENVRSSAQYRHAVFMANVMKPNNVTIREKIMNSKHNSVRTVNEAEL